jgi:arylsulfatase A-like enzyme
MAGPVRNVLFIMADQLRWDHLGCAGHPSLRTPNLDALAARGVRFTHAFTNSGVCVPSRMSFYTGRYAVSHGATWNAVPLPLGELTLGDYLRPHGRAAHLAGKSHVRPDAEGLQRLGIPLADSGPFATGGFLEWDRYDGYSPPRDDVGYGAFLRLHGYGGDDPWNRFVVSSIDAQGEVHSGWRMRNAGRAAAVAEAHSETAYMTGRALEFIHARGDEPWVLHLSYVKPHWPYVAPSPYHAMYRAQDCLPVVRSRGELEDPHPVVAAYRRHDEAVAFQSQACIDTVRPVYQGLVRQLDDQLGRVFELLDRRGLSAETMVIFTSDHGDLLGDHWLGEKELFYDAVQRIPLIVCDPRTQADATRGQVIDGLVEAVDVLPTILDALDLPVAAHRVEGTSLVPMLRGAAAPGRPFVYSELDYAFRKARLLLGLRPDQARAFSLRDARWRYVFWTGYAEQLYDLESDPHELQDLGCDSGHEPVRQAFRDRLAGFLSRRKVRTTISEADVDARTDRHREHGVRFGEW